MIGALMIFSVIIIVGVFLISAYKWWIEEREKRL